MYKSGDYNNYSQQVCNTIPLIPSSTFIPSEPYQSLSSFAMTWRRMYLWKSEMGKGKDKCEGKKKMGSCIVLLHTLRWPRFACAAQWSGIQTSHDSLYVANTLLSPCAPHWTIGGMNLMYGFGGKTWDVRVKVDW